MALWILGVKVFRRFALNKNRIRTHFQYGMHRQDVRFDDVLKRGDKTLIAFKLFVPPPKRSRKEGANKHLVHGCVKLDPGKPACKGLSIFARTTPGSRGSENCRSNPALRNDTGQQSEEYRAGASSAKVTSVKDQSYLPGPRNTRCRGTP